MLRIEVLFALKNIAFLLSNDQEFLSELFSFSQQFSLKNSLLSHRSKKWELIVGNVLAIVSFLPLIPLFILRLLQPSTNDFIECDRVDTKKMFRSAPPPYEEIDKNNAVSFGPTADSDRH